MQRKIRKVAFTALLLATGIELQAQEMIGTTGGLNIPTAEMQPSGTFKGGINYIGKGSITGEDLVHHDDCWQFDYNTCLYYLDFTPFSWLELSMRYSKLRSRYQKNGTLNEDYDYERTDRSISIRVQPLRESHYCPAVVLGCNDPYQDTGHGIYVSYYGVVSKHLHSQRLQSTLLVTGGYAVPMKHAREYDGVFGGIKYMHDRLPGVALEVEYDTRGVNVGIQALLFKHLSLFAFTHEFSNFNCGASYQYTIKY